MKSGQLVALAVIGGLAVLMLKKRKKVTSGDPYELIPTEAENTTSTVVYTSKDGAQQVYEVGTNYGPVGGAPVYNYHYEVGTTTGGTFAQESVSGRTPVRRRWGTKQGAIDYVESTPLVSDKVGKSPLDSQPTGMSPYASPVTAYENTVAPSMFNAPPAMGW